VSINDTFQTQADDFFREGISYPRKQFVRFALSNCFYNNLISSKLNKKIC